jgi:very-short-patch-repair endonuclease
MKVDLINMTKRIAVEVQGAQHESFNKFFHNNSRANYLKSITRDHDKIVWLENNNFKILEIFEADLASLSKKYIFDKFKVSI